MTESTTIPNNYFSKGAETSRKQITTLSLQLACRCRFVLFAVRRRHAKKVLTVSSRPDLNSRQLVAFIRGELFFVCVQWFRRSLDPNLVSSNSCFLSGHTEGQWLEPAVRWIVTEFKSSRHSRGSSLWFESDSGSLTKLVSYPNHSSSATTCFVKESCVVD
jgi:hypothetical protein